MFTPFCGHGKFLTRVTFKCPKFRMQRSTRFSWTNFPKSNCTYKDPALKLLQDSFKNPLPYLLVVHGCYRNQGFYLLRAYFSLSWAPRPYAISMHICSKGHVLVSNTLKYIKQTPAFSKSTSESATPIHINPLLA